MKVLHRRTSQALYLEKPELAFKLVLGSKSATTVNMCYDRLSMPFHPT